MNNLKIDSVVFCEGVRTELGGKHTLLGATAPELNISNLPAAIPVVIWISGTPSTAGPFEAEFRAVGEKRNVLVKAKLGGEIGGTGKVALVIGPMTLPVEVEGDFVFEWNFGAKKWTRIGKLRIQLAKNNAITNPSPSG